MLFTVVYSLPLPQAGDLPMGLNVQETLANLTFVDWCVFVGTACTLLMLLYAILERHFPKDRTMAEKSRSRLPFALAFLAVGAFAADAIDRHFFNTPPVPIIQEYGMLPGGAGGFFANINTGPLLSYKDTDKLLLIMRVAYADVDRMTDNRIDKSTEYTITGLVTQLALVLPLNYKMNISSTKTNMIDYSVVLVPTKVSPDLIKSLSDVERLGGRIVDSRGQGLGPIQLRLIQPSSQSSESSTVKQP
jgi:hypothetical protein